MTAETTGKKHIYNSKVAMWLSFIRRVGIGEFTMMIVRHFAARHIIERLPKKRFSFDDQSLEYFYHKYNITWVTERVLEVAIGRHYLHSLPAQSVLEVGNVLSHYATPEHQVLDKFEKGPHIINEDIVSYKPKSRFRLILSISTFEHIGYEDDGDADADKIIEAITACQKLLEADGKLVITVPFGYNFQMDDYIRTNRICPAKARFFEKTSKLDWVETTKEKALTRSYGKPYPYANAIMVAEFPALS